MYTSHNILCSRIIQRVVCSTKGLARKKLFFLHLFTVLFLKNYILPTPLNACNVMYVYVMWFMAFRDVVRIHGFTQNQAEANCNFACSVPQSHANKQEGFVAYDIRKNI